LRENGTLAHCPRVTSDGTISTQFNVGDAFKVSIMANDLNQLKITTLKNADKKKAFVWDR
jgi:glutamine synthetase type III